MEIFFNELSVLPHSGNDEEARTKIIMLLDTMKSLREHDFNILRTHDSFYAEDIGNGYSFNSFVNDPEVKNNLKLLLRSIVKNPFIADHDSYEAEMFIINKFETNDDKGNIVSPEGLAISYVHEVPTLSLSGLPYWDSAALSLTKIHGEVREIYDIINISTPESLANSIFLTWKQSIAVDIKLNSYKNIIQTFPLENFEFDARAINEIISWYYDDKRYVLRIKNLINNIREAPFVGGLGLTENLGGGKGSKRIVKKDRVVYTVLDEKIIIHSCKKHYDDK